MVYSYDIKARAVQLYREGAPVSDIAQQLGVNRATIGKWANNAGLWRKRPREKKQDEPVNPLLLGMANGNDLSAFRGRTLLSLQPREIWDFLRALNIKGDIQCTQVMQIKL